MPPRGGGEPEIASSRDSVRHARPLRNLAGPCSVRSLNDSDRDVSRFPALNAAGFPQRIKKALGKLGSQGGLGFLVSAESDWTSVDKTSVSGRTLLG